MTTTNESRAVCRCGVYTDLHPVNLLHNQCEKPRPAHWWHLHSAGRHIAVALWWTLPRKIRWSIVDRYHALRPSLCWCDLFDSAWKAEDDYRSDYTGLWGCKCDAPLPTDAVKWRTVEPGRCYCSDRAHALGIEV